VDVCLMIEGQEGVTWEQWVAIARACEEHGLHGLFRSDHYLSFDRPRERGALDAWSTIAALGPITERIRLGTMVSPVTFRHPSLLAKAVVSADHASGGRVELGIGAGWFEREHEAYGFPFPPTTERMDLLAEQIEIVHRLWDRDEDEVTFEGRHYRLDACVALPKPFQRPHPPLIMGGGAGPRSVQLAARWADEYDVHAVDPAEARRRRDRVAAACEAIGRDPATIRFSIMTTSLVGADRSELERRARALLEVEGETIDAETFLAEPRPHQLVGTVDQVLERLGAFAEAGVDRVLLQHLVHDDLDMVELVGREIVPAVAAL
jgi:F420-dependent oxidoreductase-like protein